MKLTLLISRSILLQHSTFLLSIIFSVSFLPKFAFVAELQFVDRHVYIIIKRIYTHNGYLYQWLMAIQHIILFS